MSENPPLGLFALAPLVSRAWSFAISWTLAKASVDASIWQHFGFYLAPVPCSAFLFEACRCRLGSTKRQPRASAAVTYILVAVALRALDEYTIFLFKKRQNWWIETLIFEVLGFTMLALSPWLVEGIRSILQAEGMLIVLELLALTLGLSVIGTLASAYAGLWLYGIVWLTLYVILPEGGLRHDAYYLVLGALRFIVVYVHWYFLRSKPGSLPQDSELPVWRNDSKDTQNLAENHGSCLENLAATD